MREQISGYKLERDPKFPASGETSVQGGPEDGLPDGDQLVVK